MNVLSELNGLLLTQTAVIYIMAAYVMFFEKLVLEQQGVKAVNGIGLFQ